MIEIGLGILAALGLCLWLVFKAEIDVEKYYEIGDEAPPDESEAK